MRKVLYSKFSKDREKKYQIQTLILEQDGEKKILNRFTKKEKPIWKTCRNPIQFFLSFTEIQE